VKRGRIKYWVCVAVLATAGVLQAQIKAMFWEHMICLPADDLPLKAARFLRASTAMLLILESARDRFGPKPIPGRPIACTAVAVKPPPTGR